MNDPIDNYAADWLQPAEEHFIDSVHLDERSQEQAGLYLAGALAPLLTDSVPEPSAAGSHGAATGGSPR